MAKSESAADHVLNAVGLARAFAAVREAAGEVVADTQKPDVFKELLARHMDKALGMLREKGLTVEVMRMIEEANSECKAFAPTVKAPPPPAAGAPPPEEEDDEEEKKKKALALAAAAAPVDAAAAPPADPTAKAGGDPWAWSYGADFAASLRELASSS
jgi:hypothetical protein